jgi:NAD(P)-dependent dehydrogenase (short-subunit alcohol dehydrogenase family)
MDGLLQGKVVVITGAGAGVGRAATILFAKHGAKVLAVDVALEAAEESAKLARDEGGIAIAQHCDVTNYVAVSAAVETAVREFGRIDVMYNNAGVATKLPEGGGVSSFLDGSYEELMRIMGINAGGVANGCRAAMIQFRKQGRGGVIVNTSSIAGLIAYGGADYSATKGAVSILTRSLAMEAAKDGIRVNAVCPCAMPTNFGFGVAAWTDKAREMASGMQPLGELVDPLDCANAALFLASDLASNITGVNLPVDGGIAAGVRM